MDDELAKGGLAGPVQGNVTAVNQGVYTVWYTDKNGVSQTGRGPSANGTGTGTEAPEVGDTVSVYYSTTDPSQIVILNIPGGGLAGIAGGLRTIGIVCLAVGALLLLVGIIGLIAGRKKAVAAVPAYPAAPLPPGQGYPDQPGPSPGYPQQPPAGYPQQPTASRVSATATAARATRSNSSRRRPSTATDPAVRRTKPTGRSPRVTRPSWTWTADRVPITPDLNPP